VSEGSIFKSKHGKPKVLRGVGAEYTLVFLSPLPRKIQPIILLYFWRIF
jgi:hypothetical protein